MLHLAPKAPQRLHKIDGVETGYAPVTADGAQGARIVVCGETQDRSGGHGLQNECKRSANYVFPQSV